MNLILKPNAIVVRGYLQGLAFAVIIFGACEEKNDWYLRLSSN